MNKIIKLNSNPDGGEGYIEITDDKVVFFDTQHSPLLKALKNKIKKEYGLKDKEKLTDNITICKKKNTF